MYSSLIYILGAGNSGSTLLSMILGAHSCMTSVGELVQLDRWVSNSGLCSCGSTLPQCKVWGPIINHDINRVNTPVAPISKRANIIFSNSMRFRHDLRYSETIQRNLDLYNKICEIQKVSTIVDSSKDPLHFYYLYRSGYFRILPILLVRHGEDYMESALRRGSSRFSAISRWISLNIAANRVLKELRLQTFNVHIKFKDLVNNPLDILQSICTMVGLAYETEMFDFYKFPHHNIAGTRTRFKPRPIENDTNKIKNLSFLDRLTFRAVGGNLLNKYFGA